MFCWLHILPRRLVPEFTGGISHYYICITVDISVHWWLDLFSLFVLQVLSSMLVKNRLFRRFVCFYRMSRVFVLSNSLSLDRTGQGNVTTASAHLSSLKYGLNLRYTRSYTGLQSDIIPCKHSINLQCTISPHHAYRCSNLPEIYYGRKTFAVEYVSLYRAALGGAPL